MRELSKEEINEINGGFIANAVGAVAGGLGSGYGYIIGAGQGATAMGVIGAVTGGALMGAINPASGAMSIIRSAGIAAFGGAAIGGYQGYMGSNPCAR